MTLRLGLDLGGTNVKWALVGGDGVVASGSAATLAEDGPRRVVDRLVEVGRAALDGRRADAVGVGVPGVFDAESGTATFFPNLPGAWAGTPVATPIAAALGAPTVLVNDARAFAIAESKVGAARGCSTAVFVTVGTGVGGGVVVDGRLHLGAGTAGELGHQTVDPDGPMCGCGNRGCVEAVACAGAIAAAGGRSSVEEVVEAARAGDARARDAIERAGRQLGIALANAVLLLAPERIVVGGGVAGARELLLEPIRAELRERVRVAPVEQVEVVPASLGHAAGAIGAALWAAEWA